MPAVDGIVSGFDTSALIDAIATAYSGPLEIMESNLERYKDQLDKTAGLSNRLEDLSSAIEALQGDDGLLAFTANASVEGAFTATVGADVAPGTYTVEVNSLATNETEASQGFADPDANDLKKGTFSVTYDGVTTDIELDDTNNTLTDLAAAIDDIEGLSAYVLDTRDGSGSPYKLVVSGDKTGSDAGITLDTSGLNGGGTEPTFTEQTTAVDASITVNNMVVNSEGNTFDGIPGLSIDLLRAGDGPVQLTVGLDQEAMAANVQAFVDSYNEVVSYYSTNTAFDQENGINGALVGDSTARRVMSGLGTLVSSQVTVAGSDFSALAQIGIATNQDGTLSLDNDALAEALSDDLQGVRTMLLAEDGPMGVFKSTIDDIYVDETNGVLASR
jgi:flagellar hook-associated protein 2